MMSKYSVVRATIGEAIKQQAMTVLTAMCSAFHAAFTSRCYPLVVVMKTPGHSQWKPESTLLICRYRLPCWSLSRTLSMSPDKL